MYADMYANRSWTAVWRYVDAKAIYALYMRLCANRYVRLNGRYHTHR